MDEIKISENIDSKLAKLSATLQKVGQQVQQLATELNNVMLKTNEQRENAIEFKIQNTLKLLELFKGKTVECKTIAKLSKYNKIKITENYLIELSKKLNYSFEVIKTDTYVDYNLSEASCSHIYKHKTRKSCIEVK